MAKKFLNDAGIAYDTVVVDKDPAMAKQFGVRQAPTLLLVENGREVQRVENPSNIRLFAESYR
jgi:ribonucleoside-triphosphate reductase